MKMKKKIVKEKIYRKHFLNNKKVINEINNFKEKSK